MTLLHKKILKKVIEIVREEDVRDREEIANTLLEMLGVDEEAEIIDISIMKHARAKVVIYYTFPYNDISEQTFTLSVGVNEGYLFTIETCLCVENMEGEPVTVLLSDKELLNKTDIKQFSKYLGEE